MTQDSHESNGLNPGSESDSAREAHSQLPRTFTASTFDPPANETTHPHEATEATQQSAPTPPPPAHSGPTWGGVIGVSAAAVLVAGLLGGGAGYFAHDYFNDGSDSTSTTRTSTSNQTIQTTETPDWTTIAAEASKSVVAIQVGSGDQISELGSGFVYQPEGANEFYILTNNHVVASGDSGNDITAVFNNGSNVRAEIVGRDPETDVAVLRMAQTPPDIQALAMGDSQSLSVGEPVMALGNPLGLADSVTTGIISAQNRPVSTTNQGENVGENVATITSAIQTDAAINPGNSGGPLVNGAGAVIGITSSAAALSDGGGQEQQSGSIGIGFAIPIYQATDIANQLIESGEAQHSFLGVEVTTGEVEQDGVAMATAVVESVEDGSPAAQLGLQKGDHIVAFNGSRVSSAVNLQALVRSTRAGDTVPITIIRGGTEEEQQVTVQAR